MPEEVHNEAEDIEIRTDEVQEILTAIPHWIIRWGMTVVFLSVAMVITASFFIKYPDTIDSRIVLTTEIPPTRVVALSSGKVDFFVEDKQMVEKEFLLGVIDNPAITEDVINLENQLEPLVKEWQRGVVSTNLKDWEEDWQLGSLQPGFLLLRNALLNYDRYLEIDFYTQQIAALENRILSYKELNGELDKQNAIYRQELDITEEQFAIDSTLYASKSLTQREYATSRNQLLQTRRAYQASRNQVINNKITIDQLRAQIGELRLNQQREEDELKSAIEENLRSLESQVEGWKQQFLLQAPISGQITFSAIWSDNQFVAANTEVLTIVPDTTQMLNEDLIGQVLAPVRNSGKLEIGQRVNIRFDNYPANEYGMVLGEVINISTVPTGEFYNVQVRLKQGLKSTYKKDLDYRPEMSGSAQIITEDLRLIERIFNQFRALVDRTS
ncbi:MAG TPA: hypothetical protein DCE41_00155 [Cytophagales bacterium]|nr:hypothetical protein [Cytophagales bacterium]HAA18841.1 hypothetical protein [Cytophagales bacterium]HAP60883.1 hypothetical protein [Cytophagales bacterium]